MWSIETEVPEERYCDVQWVDELASFTCQGCPFLLLAEGAVEEDGDFVFHAPSVLHEMVRRMGSLVADSVDLDEPIRIPMDDVVASDHPHRPHARWHLIVRPQWRTAVGPVWGVVNAQWIPSESI